MIMTESMEELMESDEVFFSIDIETDGPIPLQNSLLSLGCAAFSPNGKLIDTFEVNLSPMEGAVQDPSTMEFWSRNQEAWNHSTQNQIDPTEGMTRFKDWVHTTAGGKLRTAVCFPSGFDFTFVYVYFVKLGVPSPFSFSCIDVKSYASAVRQSAYSRAGKRYWPGRWFDKGLPHTHKAIDDAIEQGLSFIKMRAEHFGGPEATRFVSDMFWRNNSHVKKVEEK